MTLARLLVSGSLIAGGVLAFLAAGAAERKHSRAFEEHIERLEAAQRESTAGYVTADEVERFHEDETLDRYIWAMEWGNVLGVLLIMGGAVAWVVL